MSPAVYIVSKLLTKEYCRQRHSDPKRLFPKVLFEAENVRRKMKKTIDYGGSANKMALNMDMAAAVFGLYNATGKRLGAKELFAVIGGMLPRSIPVITPFLKKHFGIFAFLIRKGMKAAGKDVVRHRAKGEWRDAWSVYVEPKGKDESVRIVLTGCPIVKFAAENGYVKLMPALCGSDYLTSELMGARLIRPYTIAQGHKTCPYTYVPSGKKRG